MKRKAILFVGLIAAFAAIASAQSNNFQEQAVRNSLGTTELSRPRIVEEKAAAVKASIVVNTASIERIAFDLINQKRVENGFRQLEWSDEVARIARQHSQDMAEFKYFGHRGLDDSMVSDRADRSGLKKWRAIGENIAFNRGYKDPVEVAVKLWLESPSHRQNLLKSDWGESAVGIAVAADGSYYFTQVFLTRK
jgi:uncharacterized protein YkwD